jgi:hypothetical protein
MNIDLTVPYKKIVETIGNKPIAYETTGIPFWDDEYTCVIGLPYLLTIGN